VPSEGAKPRPASITGAAAGTPDVPVRVVPVRAALVVVREDAFRRVPVERLAVFLRPVERDAVFLRAPERDAVFLRAPVERLAVFLRPVERDAVFLRAPVERDAVLRAAVERVVVRAEVLRVVPLLERVLEVFLRALAIRAPPR
jgi:hypothetical protein